ncbi:MAG: family 78 glycoside hydrolase catalytic domain [Candidatus Hydrogenedentes bacterium]|nr:family 78 glycoside hydrolase catalytic domain [Candidatus Hydrogenedentota bacterium]
MRAMLGIAATIVLGATAPLAHADLEVTKLRCEYRVNPLGIDVAAPRLSWVIESKQRGQVQTAYQILVADTEDALNADQGVRWDSGKVKSNRTIHIPYAGAPLKSQDRCYWKVRVWDKDGKESKWSKPAMWTMGLLTPAEWKGSWIGLDGVETATDLSGGKWIWFPEGTPAQSGPVASRFFRRVITLPADRTLRKASAQFAADNRHALYINGQRVDTGSSFKAAAYVDITAHLHPGDNIAAAQADNEGDAANPAGLIGILRFEFTDGEKITITTDESWMSAEAAEDEWFAQAFDDSLWKPAMVLGEHGMDPWGKVTTEEARELPARYLRHEFNADKPIRRATAYISGLGLSELYLNGKKVGNDVLTPSLTEYTKRTYYLTYDVTGMLRKGENAVGVILGNGRYYAPRSNVPTAMRTFGFPKLMFDLRITYEDGSEAVVASGTDWKLTAEGPVGNNNEYDGEVYDARKEMPGWAEPGFADESWAAAQAVSGPEGPLVAQMIEPIRVIETLKPVSVKQIEPGKFIFDMGQNMVGWCLLRVKGPAGTTVRLHHAETLKDDGSLYVANLRGAKCEALYTLKGEGQEVYEPRFTYFGFRFVEVTGYPGEPTLDDLEGKVVHDDLERIGQWASSNPLLNQIYSNVLWGVRGNYRSMPTDCPQRDERQGWLGDRSAECRGESYLHNIAPLYNKWHTDMLDSQKENGSIPDVAPYYWPIYSDNVTWPSSYVIIPGMLFDQYGDRSAIEQRYEGMKRWIEMMRGFLDKDIMPRDTYGDWCVPPESQELIHSKDPARKTSGPILGTTYFYHTLCLMARYAELLGKTSDATEYLGLAGRMKAALNRDFYKADSSMYDNGTQTSSVLPLAFGMVPEENRAGVFNHLVDNITNVTNSHVGTGLVGGQWLMRTLSDNGRADLAYTIATQKTYPSWGYMVEKGATTIWELWNGDTADPAMNSGNHVMLVGDLMIWFYEYLGGIRPATDGSSFQNATLKPYVPGDLKQIDASVATMNGLIESKWRREDKAFHWAVRIPANGRAKVSVPTLGWGEVSITEGGKPIWKDGAFVDGVEGISAGAPDGDWITFEVKSGTYAFECVPKK